MRKLCKILSLLIATYLISSCTEGDITITDMAVNWDAGSDGAVVTYLISPKVEQIPKAQWDIQRVGNACLSEADFGTLRSLIEKLCAANQDKCSLAVQARINQFFRRVDNRDRR